MDGIALVSRDICLPWTARRLDDAFDRTVTPLVLAAAGNGYVWIALKRFPRLATEFSSVLRPELVFNVALGSALYAAVRIAKFFTYGTGYTVCSLETFLLHFCWNLASVSIALSAIYRYAAVRKPQDCCSVLQNTKTNFNIILLPIVSLTALPELFLLEADQSTTADNGACVIQNQETEFNFLIIYLLVHLAVVLAYTIPLYLLARRLKVERSEQLPRTVKCRLLERGSTYMKNILHGYILLVICFALLKYAVDGFKPASTQIIVEKFGPIWLLVWIFEPLCFALLHEDFRQKCRRQESNPSVEEGPLNELPSQTTTD